MDWLHDRGSDEIDRTSPDIGPEIYVTLSEEEKDLYHARSWVRLRLENAGLFNLAYAANDPELRPIVFGTFLDQRNA